MKFNLLKKGLLIGGIIGCLVGPMMSNGAVFADCRSFLGFDSWDCNIGLENDSVSSEGELKNVALGIALNILKDLTTAASYLTLAWIMWGGYKYMFAKGDVGKVAEGKKTLINAFIGLAIVMLSTVIFSAIRTTISSGSGTECAYKDETDACIINLPNSNAGNVDQTVINTIKWFISMSGVVAVIFVVYGGISYITAAGDAGKLVKAKNSIIYALIGLFIVILSMVITNFVKNNIENSKTSMIINEMPVLAEECYENKVS